MGQIRDWDKAMLDAAQMMAKTGILWQLKNPDGTVTPIQGSPRPWSAASMLFGPPGYEASSSTPRNPRPSSNPGGARKRRRWAAA